MTHSAIYQGYVAHNRPGKHRLRYRVFMLALDLDELPALTKRLRRFTHNRAGWLSLYDRDHASRTEAPLKPQIEVKLRSAGIRWSGGRIVMLSMPRMLGYVFNPLTVYFCSRHDGELAAIVHEVKNTFGEQHFYVMPPASATNGDVTQACEKDFFVSPFLEMDLSYEFRIVPPAESVSVAMVVKRGRDTALTASFAGERRELTDANILHAWIAHPAMTQGVIAGIHWEALKMLAKGVRFIGRRGGAKPVAPPTPAPDSP